MGIVAAVVAELTAHSVQDVLAHRRWVDPLPGGSVVVVTSESTWAAGTGSAEYPLVKVLIYSASSQGQEDAEQVGEPVTAAVRRALHLLDGHAHRWGDQRVIASQHVGSSLAEVEGREAWRLRTASFEVQTA